MKTDILGTHTNVYINKVDGTLKAIFIIFKMC